VLVEYQLRLQQLQLQAHRAKIVPEQKIVIAERQAVGGREGLGRFLQSFFSNHRNSSTAPQ
jgi:hypothetical protein